MSVYKSFSPKKAESSETTSWLPFADLVEARFPGLSFNYKGVNSNDSVMVVPFRLKDEKWEVGVLIEERPLFYNGLLSAFPAGKINPGQSPEEAARLETLQEGGREIRAIGTVGVEPDMPFLHLCNERIYLFVAEVTEKQLELSLEEGEFISDKGLIWISWDDFKLAIRKQQLWGTPLLHGAPMKGVSLTVANKLLALWVEPKDAFSSR